MIVCKFGGSSVADAAQIRKVEEILASRPERTHVVVSAPGKRDSSDIKITDMLYTCQRAAAQGESIESSFGQIRTRYLDIAKELDIRIAPFAEELDRIEANITAGATSDYAASRGEYLCAKMIAEYLGWEFVETEGFIRIQDDGSIAPATYEHLAGRMPISEGIKYIIPGFYGSSMTGEVKTFSRGGSDITGAIIAQAVGAELYENWTDVSGILMADPRVIDGPLPIAEITYDEIRELASVGASVFHEEAIAPVRDAEIPINVKNTNRPEDPGTMILSHRDDTRQPIVGVSGKLGYCRLFVKKLFLNKRPEFSVMMNTILKVHGISPEFSSIGFDSISYFFKREMMVHREELLTRILTDLEPDEISCDARIAMIGVIGEGLYESKGIIARVTSAVSEAGVPVRYLNYGGSLITCILGVDEEDYKVSLNAMYTAIASWIR